MCVSTSRSRYSTYGWCEAMHHVQLAGDDQARSEAEAKRPYLYTKQLGKVPKKALEG